MALLPTPGRPDVTTSMLTAQLWVRASVHCFRAAPLRETQIAIAAADQTAARSTLSADPALNHAMCSADMVW
jgi:hypothetical protein